MDRRRKARDATEDFVQDLLDKLEQIRDGVYAGATKSAEVR